MPLNVTNMAAKAQQLLSLPSKRKELETTLKGTALKY
jgi:hypothetical protein